MEHVKWVTANTRNDVMGVLFGVLTDGKDYKVLEVYDQWEDGFSYTVKTDTGAFKRLHESWFDKPATLKPQPTPCDEVGCDSFDDLVYIAPDWDVSLDYNNLSSEQKDFLLSTLIFEKRFGHNEVDACSFSYGWRDKKWFTEKIPTHPKDKVTTFNQLFKHKSEV